jgi:hypothetical protein
MTDTFDLVAHTKSAARDALNTLASPDDDILPVVLTHGPHGLHIMGVPMPSSDSDKDELADFISARVAVAQATEATMVCPAYASAVNAETGVTQERQEVIMLLHAGPGVQEAWFAPITRHEDRPPDMSIWEDMGDGCMMGRFATALETGLCFAESSYADPDLAKILEDGHREGRIDEMTRMFMVAKEALKGSNSDVSNGSA